MAEDRLQRVIFFLILSLICCNLAIYFQNESIDVLRRAMSSLERDRSQRLIDKSQKYWDEQIEQNRRRMEILDELVDERAKMTVKEEKKGAHSG